MINRFRGGILNTALDEHDESIATTARLPLEIIYHIIDLLRREEFSVLCAMMFVNRSCYLYIKHKLRNDSYVDRFLLIVTRANSERVVRFKQFPNGVKHGAVFTQNFTRRTATLIEYSFGRRLPYDIATRQQSNVEWYILFTDSHRMVLELYSMFGKDLHTKNVNMERPRLTSTGGVSGRLLTCRETWIHYNMLVTYKREDYDWNNLVYKYHEHDTINDKHIELSRRLTPTESSNYIWPDNPFKHSALFTR